MFIYTILLASIYFLILRCLLVTTKIVTDLRKTKVCESTKPPGIKTYGALIQKLEDSVVYKLDNPSMKHCTQLINDLDVYLNLTIDFFPWLIVDDKEEIKYAQQFLKNGVPQIVTRNYTGTKLLKVLKIDVKTMLLLMSGIRKLDAAWVKFRQPEFMQCYNNEAYYEKLLQKYRVEGYPEIQFTTDDMEWPLDEEDYAPDDPMRIKIAAEKKAQAKAGAKPGAKAGAKG